MMQSIRKVLPLALAMLFVAVANAPVRAQQPQPEAQPPLYLGTAWYPEQWPESRWDVDLTLMEQAGIRFVRITEFAWSSIEPMTSAAMCFCTSKTSPAATSYFCAQRTSSLAAPTACGTAGT